MGNLSVLARREGQLKQAHVLEERAVQHQKTALKCQPQFHFAGKFLRDHHRNLSQVLADRGNYAEAARVAMRINPNRWQESSDVAYVFIRCMKQAAADVKTTPFERDAAIKSYAARINTLLRKATQMTTTDPMGRHQIALKYINLGVRHADFGHRDQAKQAYCTSQRLLEELSDKFPKNRDYQQALTGVLTNLRIIKSKTDTPKP